MTGMGKLLDSIDSPDDLKQLSIKELTALSEEIREFILGSVSKTGGHLASSLGVVELTLALHYVFNFKTDTLLWDVGHQSYVHKIITGRKGLFKKLRQADGISGFPNPAESDYDKFAVGHAGTSIATAIGIALGQSQLEKDDKIVALVGDASIVNGTSFEALNNLGLVKRQLLIVLNDNSMAIDSTPGAVAKYFSKIRLSQTYEDLRKTATSILDHTPVIGKSMEEAIERIKKSIRMVLPASQMFESLNIPYFGPVNGYDVESLVELFKALSEMDHPAILHVYTKKGKGFEPASESPGRFHSTGPFSMNGDSIESGKGRRSFTKVFGDTLIELAEKDERIVAITSAMTDGTGLAGFREKFPNRFYDVGIAESAAVDIAAGMAKCGLRPVVCIYSTFLQRSFDQIFQEVSLQNLPVVFCVDRAGLVGSDGPTHNGVMDIGFLRMMPNIVLTAPADEADMKRALKFAINEGKPVVIRYPKDYIPIDGYDRSGCGEAFKLGKSVYVRRGDDASVAIVTYGSILTEALKAAELLERDGLAVDVINARFAAPVDEELVELLGKGKDLITVEDHRIACGFGSALLELSAAKLPKRQRGRLVILGLEKRFIQHDTRASQLKQAGINADKIEETVRKMCKKRRSTAKKG